jgi:hypothetical protein
MKSGGLVFQRWAWGIWLSLRASEMVIRSFRFRKHPSGFVTTQEAGQFRQLVEFGYKMAYLSTQEHGDMQAICKGMGMPEEA